MAGFLNKLAARPLTNPFPRQFLAPARPNLSCDARHGDARREALASRPEGSPDEIVVPSSFRTRRGGSQSKRRVFKEEIES